MQVKSFLPLAESSTALMGICHSVLAGYASNPMPKLSSAKAPQIYVTEMVENNDPRAISPEMRAAIMSEVRDLLRPDTFKMMLKE